MYRVYTYVHIESVCINMEDRKYIYIYVYVYRERKRKKKDHCAMQNVSS